MFAWNKQIRVKPASKSPDGKTLSRTDVPEEKWNKFGLVPPIPEVSTKIIISIRPALDMSSVSFVCHCLCRLLLQILHVRDEEITQYNRKREMSLMGAAG